VGLLLDNEDHTDMRKLAEKAEGLQALHQPQGHDLHTVVITANSVASTQVPASPEEDLVAA
jgi:hypothetical protein